jgi:hypothetical protein
MAQNHREYALELKKEISLQSNECCFKDVTNENMAKIAYLESFDDLKFDIDYTQWSEEMINRIRKTTEISNLTEMQAFQISLCLIKYSLQEYKEIMRTKECYLFLGAPMNEPQTLFDMS